MLVQTFLLLLGTQRSYLLERPNGSAQFECQTRLLHSFEPEILLQTITELHQDISIGQVVKYYLHYDRLLFDLTESISKQTFLDNENNLWEKCQSFLNEKIIQTMMLIQILYVLH